LPPGLSALWSGKRDSEGASENLYIITSLIISSSYSIHPTGQSPLKSIQINLNLPCLVKAR
jgi:hypothetical protein